jgi:hypothetical protein
VKRSRLLIAAAIVAFFAANYVGAYAFVRHQNVTTLGGTQRVTRMHISGQADLAELWAFVPAMTVERWLGGRDTIIVDGVSWQSYLLSESLPPLIADPNDHDRATGNHC